MPRSVIRPATSRAGVTSKAGLAAGVSSGEIRTWVTEPSGARPCTNDTSSAERSSIGISASPSRTDQSIVGDGSAT